MQAFLSVGLGTQASRSGLSLSRGTSYYVTVKGCNGAGLCSQVSTNGIAVDPSPPVPGQVLDGCFGRVDVQYQASRFVLVCVCVCKCWCVCAGVCAGVHVLVCVGVCWCVCVLVYVCLCVLVYVCLHVCWCIGVC